MNIHLKIAFPTHQNILFNSFTVQTPKEIVPLEVNVTLLGPFI